MNKMTSILAAIVTSLAVSACSVPSPFGEQANNPVFTHADYGSL